MGVEQSSTELMYVSPSTSLKEREAWFVVHGETQGKPSGRHRYLWRRLRALVRFESEAPNHGDKALRPLFHGLAG